MNGILSRREDGPADAGHGSTRVTRARLLRSSAAAAGFVAAAGGTAAGIASAARAPRLAAHDREVLRFALVLEHLQTAFYAQAVRAGHLTGEPRQFAEVVGAEESAHLRYVEAELRSGTSSPSRYHFGDAFAGNAQFVAAAVTLEETALAAYNGQAGNVSRPLLAKLARVMSVESRHAAWARGLAGKVPAPVAADVPISAAAALKAIRPYLAS